jgi:hypothetical protein
MPGSLRSVVAFLSKTLGVAYRKVRLACEPVLVPVPESTQKKLAF